MKKTLLILVCLFSFLMFKYNAYAAFTFDCDYFLTSYESVSKSGALTPEAKQKLEAVKYACNNPTVKACAENSVTSSCHNSCLISLGSIDPISQECISCVANTCMTAQDSSAFNSIFVSGAAAGIGYLNGNIEPSTQNDNPNYEVCKNFLNSYPLVQSYDDGTVVESICSDPETFSCLQTTVTDKCSDSCSSYMTDPSCLTCLSDKCLNHEQRQAIQDATTQAQTPDNICVPSTGENCDRCTEAQRGICIKMCMTYHAVTSAECYTQCVTDGNVDPDKLTFESTECRDCLHEYCNYPEVLNSEYTYNDPEVDLSTGWDFCEKHGVLVSMRIFSRAISVARIFVPILLIIFGIIELSKAVLSSDDKAISNATSSLIKKLIIGLLVFFIPTIVDSIFNAVDDYTNLNDNGCYTCFFDREKEDCDNLINNSNDD